MQIAVGNRRVVWRSWQNYYNLDWGYRDFSLFSFNGSTLLIISNSSGNYWRKENQVRFTGEKKKLSVSVSDMAILKLNHRFNDHGELITSGIFKDRAVKLNPCYKWRLTKTRLIYEDKDI